MQNFEDKNIFITGGSTGIGLATAKAFLKNGANKVYITGKNQKNLDDAIKTLGDKAFAINCDTSNIEEIKKSFKIVSSNNDKIDVFFANAGIAPNNILGETKEEDFNSMFDVNVKGLFFSVQTFLPIISDGGAIILTSSICNHTGMANLSLYSASKAAVRSFARSWANDLRERKIRVNSISPGPVLTPIMKNSLKMSDEQIEGFRTYVSSASPAGRFGETKEIADAVLFLASSEASYVNGVDLYVDGGMTQI